MVDIRGADGVYREFGMPDTLVRIHFPKKSNTSLPWFWYVPRQTPFYFSFLDGVWGPGWVRKQIYSVIKILPIDTQPEIPVTPVGFTSLEDAIRNGVPDVAWGRFRFTSNYFWKTIQNLGDGTTNPTGPRTKPLFDVVKGIPTDRLTGKNLVPIKTQITKAVNLWMADWNGMAASFNALCAAIDPAGDLGFPSTTFSLPLPHFESIFDFFEQQAAEIIYMGAVPPSFIFGALNIVKTAYAFNYKLSQLDDKKWNMSVYPPLDSTVIGNGVGSAISKDYGGYSSTVDFPIQGVDLT